MATKTRSGGGTLAAFAVLVIGAGFLYGLAKRTDRDDMFAQLTVTFEPKNRVNPVDVHVTVDGHVVYSHDKPRNSPWFGAAKLAKGQTVTLIATQSVSAKLSCAIYGVVQETREFPGAVVCKYTRTS